MRGPILMVNATRPRAHRTDVLGGGKFSLAEVRSHCVGRMMLQEPPCAVEHLTHRCGVQPSTYGRRIAALRAVLLGA